MSADINSKLHAIPTVKPRALRIFVRKLLIASLLFIAGTALWEKASRVGLFDRISWLSVEEVRIHAGWPLSPALVRSWLPPLEGRNILTLRPAALVAAIQSKPWVESVILRREYPNRVTIDVETKHAEAFALVKGVPYFLDASGAIIDKALPELLRAVDLPVLSLEKDADPIHWPVNSAVRVLHGLRHGLGERYVISQIALAVYPYFHVFFSRPRTEVEFNWENWETQLPILSHLLSRSPDPTQMGRINLVFPKKAIVSHTDRY